jgi:cytidylate kinase
MASLTIVSGSPGAGKTTISKLLAERAPRGVHIESDEFYYDIVDLIQPSLPEAREQNDTVITAVARAAGAYVEGGYDVVLEGIFGPWYLRFVVKESGVADVDYVVLRTSLEDALERVAERNQSEIADVVRKMHAPFADLGPLEHHVVQTQDRGVDEILEEIETRRTAGDFRLTNG